MNAPAPQARTARLWRVAVSGSQAWPARWRPAVWKGLDEQLALLRPGDTFVLRWGAARPDGDGNGVDYAAELWLADRAHGEHGVTLAQEPVPADWASCVTGAYIDVRGRRVKACPAFVDGRPHRRPNRRHDRGGDDTYCPSAGHLRNPDIPAHPDFPVNVLLAWCLDDSSGTSATVGYAKRYRVPYCLRSYYSSGPPQAVPAP